MAKIGHTMMNGSDQIEACDTASYFQGQLSTPYHDDMGGPWSHTTNMAGFPTLGKGEQHTIALRHQSPNELN